MNVWILLMVILYMRSHTNSHNALPEQKQKRDGTDVLVCTIKCISRNICLKFNKKNTKLETFVSEKVVSHLMMVINDMTFMA